MDFHSWLACGGAQHSAASSARGVGEAGGGGAADGGVGVRWVETLR